MSDNINRPSHYTQGKYETIDIIKDVVEDFPSYLVGNIIKYISRYRFKGGINDLKKARNYLDMLIEWMEKKSRKEKGVHCCGWRFFGC